jgi:GTP-binding protein
MAGAGMGTARKPRGGHRRPLLEERAKSARDLSGDGDQVQAAIEDSAGGDPGVDLTAGLQPLEPSQGEPAAQSGRPAVVAANKADLPAQDERAGDFAALGYPAFPVSASHNRGIEDLLAAVLPHLPPESGETEPARLKVAVVGRPNVGKSSYINRLTGHDRVIVSPVPARRGYDRRAVHR